MPRRHQFILAISLLVSGLVLALVYAYQRPRPLVEQAVRRAAVQTTQHFIVDLRLENSPTASAALPEKGAVEVHLDGDYDRTKQRPALATVVEVAIKTDSLSLQLSGEARLLEDKFYLLLNKTPPLWPALQAIKGQWVERPRGGQSANATTLPDGQLFTSVQRLGKNQYQVIATRAAILHFMNSLAATLGTALSPQQLDELRRGLGQMEQLPVTLTITPLTHRLQRLETTIAPPAGNRAHFVLQLAPPRSAVVIAAPAGAITLEAALKKR